MAKRYNGNGVYITLDGTDISAKWVSIDWDESINAVETTMGASATHIQRSEGLRDTAGTLTVGYDAGSGLASYISKIKPGIHALVFEPEGNTAGLPAFTGSVILTSLPFSQDVGKSEVSFALPFSGADTPTKTIGDGSVV